MNYDINCIIRDNISPAEKLFHLSEILSNFPYESLFPEEKVVLDAWNFDSKYGNGINDLIVNENYSEIVNGLAAIRLLNVDKLNIFKNSVEMVLHRYGINCNSEEEFEQIERLSTENRTKIAAELSVAESGFLNDIWEQGIILHSSINYIKENISVFLQRRVNE